MRAKVKKKKPMEDVSEILTLEENAIYQFVEFFKMFWIWKSTEEIHALSYMIK